MLGAFAKLYRLTSGSRATWGSADSDGIHEGSLPSNMNEMANVRDAGFDLPDTSVDVTTRGSGGQVQNDYGLDNFTLTFTMLYEPDDEDFLALVAARIARESIAVAALSSAGDNEDAVGIWGDWIVGGGPGKTEPLAESQEVTFTLKPAKVALPVEWVRIPSGS